MLLLVEYNFWILDPPVVSTPTRWCLPYQEGGRGKKQKEVHLRDTLFSLLLFFAWDSGCFPFSDPDKLVTKWSWQKKTKGWQPVKVKWYHIFLSFSFSLGVLKYCIFFLVLHPFWLLQLFLWYIRAGYSIWRYSYLKNKQMELNKIYLKADICWDVISCFLFWLSSLNFIEIPCFLFATSLDTSAVSNNKINL